MAGLFLAVTPGRGQFFDQPRTDLPPISQRRAELLKKYDADANGRLSEAERERMRKEWAAQMLSASGRRRGGFPMPPELIKEFDKDGDGDLNEEEQQELRATMQRRFEELRKKYDADGNGQLEPEEMEQARADSEAGKLPGIPRFFLMGPGGPRGGRGRGFFGARSESEFLRKFDRNGDGRLSEEELAAARAERDRQRAEGQKQAEKE